MKPLFVRHAGINSSSCIYQLEIEEDGLRSVVARIYDHEICPEHGDAKSYAEFLCRAANSHEELLLAAKNALLMLKDLSDSMYVKPEMFRNAQPVDQLFKAIAKAEGKGE